MGQTQLTEELKQNKV